MKYPLKKELIDELITRFGYPKSGAALVSSKLLHLQQPIKSIFKDWWLMERIQMWKLKVIHSRV